MLTELLFDLDELAINPCIFKTWIYHYVEYIKIKPRCPKFTDRHRLWLEIGKVLGKEIGNLLSLEQTKSLAKVRMDKCL